MDHQRHYDLLISTRQGRVNEGYVERHHIVPSALGGSDEASNIVELTGKEHYIAHLLLAKIHGGKMIHALWLMSNQHKSNSRLYEWTRKEHAKLQSKIGKARIGKANGSYGTRWICNIQLQQNKKILKEDEIPDGWIAGRNKWNQRVPSNRTIRIKKIRELYRLAEKPLNKRGNRIPVSDEMIISAMEEYGSDVPLAMASLGVKPWGSTPYKRFERVWRNWHTRCA